MVYKYYDTPKGHDVFPKLWVATKYSGAAGLMASTIDVMLHSNPQGYMQTLGRYLYITGPIVATAASFTIASNLSASMRNKDDYVNYIMGGIAAGNIVGAWRKSIMVGVVASMAFSVMACVKKSSIDGGWQFVPNVSRQYTGARAHSYDFTLTAHRPGNWTTGEQ